MHLWEWNALLLEECLTMQLVSNTNIVFNSLKADCSRSYLLATPLVAEPLSRLAALLTVCSTRVYASCTLHSTTSTAASSRRWVLPPELLDKDHLRGCTSVESIKPLNIIYLQCSKDVKCI
jgi:hypothetical protein